MEERRCVGRWGAPTALQLHGLLLLWMVLMIFFPLPVYYRLPPCGVGAQAISLFILKKKKRPMCTGQTASKWHLLRHPGAAPFPGTCP